MCVRVRVRVRVRVCVANKHILQTQGRTNTHTHTHLEMGQEDANGLGAVSAEQNNHPLLALPVRPHKVVLALRVLDIVSRVFDIVLRVLDIVGIVGILGG